MKRLFISFMLLVPVLCSGQGVFTLSSVETAEGKSASDIYNAVKTWSATAFNSAKSVTQVDNPEAFFISFNASRKYDYGKFTMMAYTGWMDYTITVQCKDGRYKVTLTNISHTSTNNHECSIGMIYDVEQQFTKGINKKYWNMVADDIKNKAPGLLYSVRTGIASAIESGAGAPDNEDW